MREPCSCGAGCDCGCCEGVEVVTPQSIANRPGLGALSYRVGTHATFLETMQARLSSKDFPALGGLTTREPGDPSLALLDAWAVVADVLTFYQERIANEGYLRTATERRSVLELARLVGYVPRPGVAASTYLAYTLEEKPKPVLAPGAPNVAAATLEEPETVIPAGAGARSVPGPGEKAQTFETSQDITARAAWNNLRVRITQPQQLLVARFLLTFSIDPALTHLDLDIVLEGLRLHTALNLSKPNDSFSFVFPSSQEMLVVGVTGFQSGTLFPALLTFTFPQRKWIILLDLKNPKRPAVSGQGLGPQVLNARLLPGGQVVMIDLLRHASIYLQGIATNLKPNDPLLIDTAGPGPDLYRVMKVEPDGANDRTRVEVQPWLPPPPASALPPAPLVGVQPETGISATALQETLESASDLETLGISRGAMVKRALSHLEPVKTALEGGAEEPELRAAITGALADLREAQKVAVEKNATRVEPWIAGLLEELEGHLAGSPAAASASEDELDVEETIAAGPPTTDISKLLGTLGKPTVPQPPSSAHLERSAGNLFKPGSDLTAQLLTVARRELRDVLYKAWANLPATPPPVLKVYALRLRASVFGHNAPLEPVRRGDGVIIGTREWELRRGSGFGGENFSLLLRPSEDNQNRLNLGVTVTIASQKLPERTFGPLQKGQEFSIDHPPAAETIVFTVIDVPNQGTLPFELAFRFARRGVTISVKETFRQESSTSVTDHVEATTSHPGTVAVELLQTFAGLNAAPVAAASSVAFGELTTIEVKGTLAGTGEDEDVLFLDNAYPQLQPQGWIVLERPDANLQGSPLVIATALEVKDVSRAAFGLTGKSTRVKLDKPWLQFDSDHPDTFAVIRGTAVFAQSEELPLAEEPLDPVAAAVCGSTIELAALYDGLKPGRWLVVSGERTDVGETDPKGNVIVPVSGVPAAELAMVAAVDQGVSRIESSGPHPPAIDLPGDRNHTTLTLAKPLAYCYKRDTVRIYGNVAKATHGETRFEVMGSGDASKANQSFTLKQPPLTYVSAPTPSGIESTLQARVNDILWHEVTCLAGVGPADRIYLVRIDDGGQTTVIFGDGKRGARLPTGAENVRATYRSGIGPEGNVKAGQISQLATRPLGVKDVINPLPATGGAGPESRDQARRNAPLAVMSLDRLVSVQDYADFARTFAGVGKSSATRISDGRVQLVHVTIAGEDDIPIREDSDLFLNLEKALLQFGEPRQPLQLALRQRFFLVVEAEVQVLPDFLWDKVEPRIRAAMVEAFGFARRDLGQGALLSEAYRTIQRVPGVDYVDINVFARRDPENLNDPLDLTGQPLSRLPAELARIEAGKIQPAQVLYLTPEVADTLILKERKP